MFFSKSNIVIYDALFKATWETVETFTCKDNKAGMISILHTWVDWPIPQGEVRQCFKERNSESGWAAWVYIPISTVSYPVALWTEVVHGSYQSLMANFCSLSKGWARSIEPNMWHFCEHLILKWSNLLTMPCSKKNGWCMPKDLLDHLSQSSSI